MLVRFRAPSSARHHVTRTRHGDESRANALASVGSLARSLHYFLRPLFPTFAIAPLPSPTSQPKRGNQMTFQNPGQQIRWRLTGLSSLRFAFLKTTTCSLLQTFASGAVPKSDQRSASKGLPIRTERSRASPLIMRTI